MSRVLIIDSEPTTRVQLTAALGRGGFDVVTTTDPASGWRVLQSPHPPRLLVLGWSLRDPAATALVARLRARPEGGACWVILASSHGEHDDRMAAFEAGADDYLVKPIDAAELRARVTAAARMVTRIESLERERDLEQLRRAA